MPDFERFPRFREAMAMARVALLEPGDALFLPRYWWHHVTSLGPFNAMVNYWWGGDDEPHHVFLAALLALRDLPPGARAYSIGRAPWRESVWQYVEISGG